MQTTTLSISNMHNHGELFANVFRARHEAFIKGKSWDLPQADGMEFDQYDTPASRWIAVHEFGQVLAGVRLTPTTHRCGIYSYMIRDAQLGLMDTIPSNLLFERAPVAEHVWESSRIFVAPQVPANKRFRVQLNLINEMTVSAREMGASMILGLMRESAPRWGRRLGLDVEFAGPIMDIGDERNACININLQSKLH